MNQFLITFASEFQYQFQSIVKIPNLHVYTQMDPKTVQTARTEECAR